MSRDLQQAADKARRDEQAMKLARGAKMLAESVLSPDAAEHPHSIALQAEAILKLAREVLE